MAATWERFQVGLKTSRWKHDCLDWLHDGDVLNEIFTENVSSSAVRQRRVFDNSIIKERGGMRISGMHGRSERG